MTQYNKAEIGRTAAQYGFVRDTFEKVLRLKEILEYFNTQEYLANHLLLKGGTAINLTVFNLPRLSVDIDMDYTPNDCKNDMLAAREHITGLIKEYMERKGYSLSSGSRFSHSLDAFYYYYINAGGNKDMIKIELNYSLRTHIFESTYRSILNDAFKSDIKIRTVDPLEIFAAKGNALISRAAARDLYDWGNMMEHNLFENHRDLFPVIGKKDNFRLNERKNRAKQYIGELMQLTEKENEYMDRFMAKEYRPELLFDDEKIMARICDHPMALWKCST